MTLSTPQRGFTIIETLVAIAILMIAVAGPLVVANRGLAASLYAKDQTIATYLAQEAMELVRHAKDVAITTHPVSQTEGFQEFFSASNYGMCRKGNNEECAIWIANGSSGFSSSPYGRCNLHNSCYMYQNTSPTHIGYINAPNGTTSNLDQMPFRRYFYVTQVNSSEYQVTVVVEWSQRSITNQVVLRSEMTARSI